MLKISKILAVFIAVGSLAFVGLAVATTFGGPDWNAELSKPYFAGYKVSQSAGENPTWSATRADGKQVAANIKALPAIIVKVLADARQEYAAEITRLNEREAALTPRIALLQAAMAKDKIALEQHEAELRSRLEQLRQQTSSVAGQAASAAAEAQKLENTIASRRDDIFRLRQQLEELRADMFQLNQMRVELDNQLTQVRGDLQRAEERAAQLQ